MIARASHLSLVARVSALGRAAVATLASWRLRSRTRRQLRGLDRRQLRDIGLDEAARSRECRRRFWEA